jgi:hypothetical protein
MVLEQCVHMTMTVVYTMNVIGVCYDNWCEHICIVWIFVRAKFAESFVYPFLFNRSNFIVHRTICLYMFELFERLILVCAAVSHIWNY